MAAAKNGGPHFDFRNEYLIDTDGDGLMEIVDMWGRLFLYDRSPEEADYPGQELGEEPYNLWSRGINGVDEFGCGDDISSWRSE